MFGIQVRKDELCIRKPNPKWDGGKTKFDNQTGEPIHVDVVEELDVDSLAKKFKLDYFETHRQDVIFGIFTSNEVDVDYGDPVEAIRFLDEKKATRVTEAARKLQAYVGLTEDVARHYLVTNAS